MQPILSKDSANRAENMQACVDYSIFFHTYSQVRKIIRKFVS